jgi:hypothetical protein
MECIFEDITARHGAGGSSKLLGSLECIGIRVNLPLQLRTPQTPLASSSPSHRRGRGKGGSYALVVSRRTVIACHSDSGALRAWREWSERTASRGRSIRRFSIASSCGGVGRCNVPPRGRGARFTVGSRQDAGSPSPWRWLGGVDCEMGTAATPCLPSTNPTPPAMLYWLHGMLQGE